jgi:hypothetical protein
MDSRLLAILRQDNQQIGLFDPLRIHQEFQGVPQHIYWFRPKHSVLETFVSSRPVLSPDPVTFTIQSQPIMVLDAERPILDHYGAIRRDQLYNSTLVRIPYVVQFWEETDYVPVYTLFPDNSLPWHRTLRSSVHLSSPITRPFQQSFQRSPLRSVTTNSVTSYASSASSASASSQTPILHDLPSLPADVACPITLETLTVSTVYWTPCQHAFSIAILQALELDSRCPLCRRYCSAEDCRRGLL